MILKRSSTIAWVVTIWLIESAVPKPDHMTGVSLNHSSNISYATEHEKLSALASIFSPRMDFDQWKPLTGRGDPLRNDPTYDYEPPVLERVHYWADDTRLEREHYPDRKSEVLMLGVSSRRPSVAARPPPSRRHQRPNVPPKYKDFSYKINDHYPMTILVPPPPPPPGHQPALYLLPDNKMPLPNSQMKITELPTFVTKPTTSTTSVPEHLTSLYALQESNLIYQSSTTTQNWGDDSNETKAVPNAVSSDYAGWGPTTPLGENDAINYTHNLIPIDHIKPSKQPYIFFKNILSESPPPLQPTSSSMFLPTFIPTALPPTEMPHSAFSQLTISVTPSTESSTDTTTTELPISVQDYYDDTTTENQVFHKTKTQGFISSPQPEKNIFDMLGPMLTMPLINGPERPEDNLYAHASENVQVFKEHSTEDTIKLETMQTMQPPPVMTKITESTTISETYDPNPHFINNIIHKKPSKFTHDPYLHMRFKTTTPVAVETNENFKSTTEAPTVPFIIIQGHSKVKTYSSKPNIIDDPDTISNEIPKLNETNEVKHLHPIKEKNQKINTVRESRSKTLKSLVDHSFGSIEIQEADIGIKYDVSDGSDVPVEIYRKGIVEGEGDSYKGLKNKLKEKRLKRQLDLEDLLPFDEDSIEEYVYNFLNGKRNSTGITGLIAQAVTSDAASVVDDLEEDDEDSEHEEDER